MRGRADPALKKALRTLRNRDKERWNANNIRNLINKHPDRYGSPAGISYNAICHAMSGRPISQHTREVLTAFIRSQDRTLLPYTLPECDLDLALFYGTNGPKMAKSALDIEGHYQAYAHSHTHGRYMRLGRVSLRFQNDPEKPRLFIEEEQYRPEIGSLPEVRLLWEGYATARGGRSYFAVMRARQDLEDGMAMMCMIEKQISGAHGINRARMYTLQYEPELGQYLRSTSLLVRVPASRRDKIKYDFVPLLEFDDDTIIKDLWLEPVIQQLMIDEQTRRNVAGVRRRKRPARRTALTPRLAGKSKA
ncbi:MAG TPA: hypothetical protein PLW75_02265 [Hyphomicrobium sp.]|nr:hypothetical protein [Hyphomicrobium sp.]